jgi:acetolactate synthase-1/2/3 large subunit
MDSEPQTRIAAEDYLDALAANGIDHLFCNPGTDFAPIVEAFARAARTNRKVPRPMVVPHENAAMSMAHGCTMVTGKPQAVMLHTNVGTANAINMLIDASRDRVPVLLTSGRTPFTETGAEGSRSAHIHWAQEMYDQAGMLREMVKWDYEMKRGDQVATVVERWNWRWRRRKVPSISRCRARCSARSSMHRRRAIAHIVPARALRYRRPRTSSN